MEKTGGSRLLQLQARFQQKQLQEREMKIASLYEAQQARALDRVRHSPINTGIAASPPNNQRAPVSHQPGKVRQMFEERRTKAGIDKSYPLQPIHNTEKPATRKPLPNGYNKVTAPSKLNVEHKISKMHMNITSHTVRKQPTQHVKTKVEKLTNGNGSGDLNHNHESDLNIKKQKPVINSELSHPIDELDTADNNYLLENETFPDALAPTPTPRSPESKVEFKKTPIRRSPGQKASPAKSKPQPTVTPPRRVISENASLSNSSNKASLSFHPSASCNVVTENTSSKARGAMHRGPSTVLSKRLSSSARREDRVASPKGTHVTVIGPVSSNSSAAQASVDIGVPCAVCGRRFNADRLNKHQAICKKAHAKKRKPFDALKHRIAGTEAEPFLSKLRKPANNPSTTKLKSLNNNWRQKHEDFIKAIRAAKQVQAHLDAGGKLSDLPPPPPSENPDYVQCPNCGRRFNKAAAERHIPKCANFQFNKPKPGPKRR